MGIEVISVHVPKAGGTSLRESLTMAFGEHSVHSDYEDDPTDPCCQFNLDPDGCRLKAAAMDFPPSVKVIHGHLPITKYDHLQNVKRIAILRPPVENVISIYYFWRAHKGDGHALFKYFRDQELSLLEMARLPALRKLYTGTYFGGVSLDRFDCIGTTESYSRSLSRFSRLLDIELQEVRSNTNAFPNYRSEVETVLADNVMVARLRDLLRDDIRFYEEAMK